MDHEHDHPHNHEHDHKHGHTHAPAEDPYYVDQMCLVIVSTAFGCICLALFFWQPRMLELMLRAQFHYYVLGSGIVLILFALARACVLWIQVGKEPAQVAPAPGSAKECCGHCAEHQHPAENHGHSHGDHEHSWAPWRYVLLLVPIMLFLMGLPNKIIALPVTSIDVSSIDERPTKIGTASSEAVPIDFQTLEGAAYQEGFRDYWRGKNVSVKGQFAPDPTDSKIFYLIRSRIKCCYADRIQLNVPILSQEAIDHIKINDWVKVTGTAVFFKDAKGYHTLLRVNNRKNVEKSAPDSDWYLSSK